MKCPSCNAEMHVAPLFADYACECGLAGPRDVLEGLAARLMSPRHVLDAVEKLFDADPRDCVIRVDAVLGGTWKLQTLMRREASGPTLAEAYEELTKGERNG